MAIFLLSVSLCSLQAGVKAKKATEAYKGLVEKYAAAKSEFEQKMAETTQVWVCVIWLFRALSSTTVECGCVFLVFVCGVLYSSFVCMF